MLTYMGAFVVVKDKLWVVLKEPSMTALVVLASKSLHETDYSRSPIQYTLRSLGDISRRWTYCNAHRHVARLETDEFEGHLVREVA